jgi:hypothetical protein
MDFGPESNAPDEPIPIDDEDNIWEDADGGPEDIPTDEGELFQHFLGEERTSKRRAYTSKQGPTYKERLAREQGNWNSIMGDLTISYMEWISNGAPMDQEGDIMAEGMEWFTCNVYGLTGKRYKLHLKSNC